MAYSGGLLVSFTDGTIKEKGNPRLKAGRFSCALATFCLLATSCASSVEAGWWDLFKRKPAAPKSAEEAAKEVGDVGIRPGRFAPDFELPEVGGGMVRLSSYRGQKAVLLNFWATWCPPCRKEMPTLQTLSRAYTKKGLVVVGVNVDSDRPETSPAVAFLKKLKVTFPNVFDHKKQAAKKYAVHGLPVTYMINREGRIMKRVFGDRDWMSPKVRAEVESLLLSADSR